MSYKQSVDVGAGVVDRDYTREVKVLLCNNGQNIVAIKKGDRVAQLIIERILNPLVEVIEGLEETSRGAGGFGSTRINEVKLDSGEGSPSEEEMIVIE